MDFRRSLTQLIAVWCAGCLLTTVAVPALIGGVEGALILAVVAVVAFRLVAGATAGAMPLGKHEPGRWWWAALVTAGGAFLLLFLYVALAAVTRPQPAHLLLAGLPFAVVSGLLLRGRRPRLAASAALLGLLAGGVLGLRFTGPDEAERRLSNAGMDRSRLFVVEIPGYLPSEAAYGDRLGGSGFMLEDRSKIPQSRYADVIAHRKGLCATPGEKQALLDYASCKTEPGGLRFRHSDIRHGYEVRRGDLTVEVVGALAVDRALLRAAALSARPAAAEGLFEVDLPGYRVEDNTGGQGTHYEVAGNDGGPYTAHIRIAGGQSVEQFCAGTRCETEPGGLTYRHPRDSRADEHRPGYLRSLSDGRTVEVVGGTAVDRALLRAAVLDARTPTDREILRAVPAPRYIDPVDRLRAFLKDHVPGPL